MDIQAKFFKALGDETRLHIVRCLLSQDYCACEFSQTVGKDQSTVSRHLKILVESGVLKYKKEGKKIIYSIKDEKVKKLLMGLSISASKCC